MINIYLMKSHNINNNKLFFGFKIFSTGLLALCVLAITDGRNMNTPSGVVPIGVGLIVVVIGRWLQ